MENVYNLVKNAKKEVKAGRPESAYRTLDQFFSQFQPNQKENEFDAIHQNFNLLMSSFNFHSNQETIGLKSNSTTFLNGQIQGLLSLIRRLDDFMIEKEQNLHIDDSIIVELKIEGNYSEFSEQRKTKVLNAIAKLLEMDVDEIKIGTKREGSIILPIELPIDKREHINRLFKEGKLKHLGITRVRNINIVDHDSQLYAVFDQESPKLFLGYFLHTTLITSDSGYKIKSSKVLPQKGTEDAPHQVIISYQINEDTFIENLRSYAVETVDLSDLDIPPPNLESNTQAPTIFIELIFSLDGSLTISKSITNSNNIIVSSNNFKSSDELSDNSIRKAQVITSKVQLVAVQDLESRNAFLGYYLYVMLVTQDSGLRITSYELVTGEGTPEAPHQVTVIYQWDDEIRIHGLQSYAAETIDISSFEIPEPEPETGLTLPVHFVEVVVKEGSFVTTHKATKSTGSLVRLNK